ncbi:glycoside hydrolase family 18 protein [Niabella drilacis]|uniref:chitinase n=1 Tax=Niabella drilacis (strain DSM 25811 / CCM 8410 / CCUG 62505 / LMG 26954 / E90) TaxID=1285928 RepID=A0A1G6KUI6_NIADE|nr:glycosyl hydrolase family 18 protein [Niabella drilacis]SDC34451.1 chitinase [Niabella drilacis]
MKSQILLLLLLLTGTAIRAQHQDYKVVAYYSGDSATLQQYDFKKITHLIYGFAHLDSTGRLAVFRHRDTAVLRAFKTVKKQYPHIRTLIALGGWGGCKPCSGTFGHADSTTLFSVSVKQFLQTFELDGIDLDWEYPALPGVPGHPFSPADRPHFTRLVLSLRKELGKQKLVTFAAGGFQKYLDQSVEWAKVEKAVDFVNLMTYDLVHGYSERTGHQSSLYSALPGEESVDQCVQFFRSIKFPLHKIIVGVPFYIRSFQVNTTANNGLFQPARFLYMRGYRFNTDSLTTANGFQRYWDNQARVPYWFNSARGVFVTGDDPESLRYKTAYIRQHSLGGIMFWELFYDTFQRGLLDQLQF